MNGNWWRIRRNGRTKFWKHQPERWQIPVKAGMSVYAYLTDENAHLFRVREDVK
jgi:hypothetical protein